MIYLIEGLKGQGYARGTHTYHGLVRARCSDPNARAPQGPCPVVETILRALTRELGDFESGLLSIWHSDRTENSPGRRYLE